MLSNVDPNKVSNPDQLLDIPYDTYGDGSEGNVIPAETVEERQAEMVVQTATRAKAQAVAAFGVPGVILWAEAWMKP